MVAHLNNNAPTPFQPRKKIDILYSWHCMAGKRVPAYLPRPAKSYNSR